MILVLTAGDYDEYGITGVFELPDDQTHLIDTYERLQNERDSINYKLRGLRIEVQAQEDRLPGLKKQHKIDAARSHIKKAQAEHLELFNRRGELAAEIAAAMTRLNQAATKLDDDPSRVRFLHAE